MIPFALGRMKFLIFTLIAAIVYSSLIVHMHFVYQGRSVPLISNMRVYNRKVRLITTVYGMCICTDLMLFYCAVPKKYVHTRTFGQQNYGGPVSECRTRARTKAETQLR